VSGVVITGVGVLTPLGWDRECLVAALRGERSGVAEHRDLVEGVAVRAARVVEVPARDVVASRQLRRMDRMGRMAAVAGTLALRDAGVLGDLPCASERVAVGWGTEFASLDETGTFQQRLRERGPRLANPMTFPNLVPSALAGHLGIIHGLRGPSLTFCHHETCGFEALAWGRRLLVTGRADLVLVGVSEEVGAVLAGTHVLLRATTPPGEGAAALVLERADDARRRSAAVLATVASTAAGNEPVSAHAYPDTSAAIRVLRRAGSAAGSWDEGLHPTLGAGHDLGPAFGHSSVLPLLHVAASIAGGQLPVGVVAAARGGALRAVVLGEVTP